MPNWSVSGRPAVDCSPSPRAGAHWFMPSGRPPTRVLARGLLAISSLCGLVEPGAVRAVHQHGPPSSRATWITSWPAWGATPGCRGPRPEAQTRAGPAGAGRRTARPAAPPPAVAGSGSRVRPAAGRERPVRIQQRIMCGPRGPATQTDMPVAGSRRKCSQARQIESSRLSAVRVPVPLGAPDELLPDAAAVQVDQPVLDEGGDVRIEEFLLTIPGVAPRTVPDRCRWNRWGQLERQAGWRPAAIHAPAPVWVMAGADAPGSWWRTRLSPRRRTGRPSRALS